MLPTSWTGSIHIYAGHFHHLCALHTLSLSLNSLLYHNKQQIMTSWAMSYELRDTGYGLPFALFWGGSWGTRRMRCLWIVNSWNVYVAHSYIYRAFALRDHDISLQDLLRYTLLSARYWRLLFLFLIPFDWLLNPIYINTLVSILSHGIGALLAVIRTYILIARSDRPPRELSGFLSP